MAALTLWFSSGGSAASAMPQIAVQAPAHGFKMPPWVIVATAGKSTRSVQPPVLPNGAISLQFDGKLLCPSANCTAVATMYAAPDAPASLQNMPLATFAGSFSSSQPLTLAIGLSQRTVKLLYDAGDPRCTVTVSVANTGSTAAMNVKNGAAAATMVQVVAATLSVQINIPTKPAP